MGIFTDISTEMCTCMDDISKIGANRTAASKTTKVKEETLAHACGVDIIRFVPPLKSENRRLRNLRQGPARSLMH
jgi:hypothetical protein